MRAVALGDLTERVRTWNPRSSPDQSFSYVDLSAVDNSAKVIRTAVRMRGVEAPSRARQLVLAGDVLVSTVRPNLNAVAVVPEALAGATASTGFAVLRPRPELHGRYLFHWVRAPAFVRKMVASATGASYPAVSDRIVRNSVVPLPSLVSQQRIAAILDQADGVRAKRHEVVARLGTLEQSVFHDMFGDPDSAVGTVRFGDVASLSSGRNLVAEDSAADSTFRVLKISSVTGGGFKPQESKPLPPNYVPPAAHLVRPGDLLMTRANTAELVGAVAHVRHVPPNLALPDKIWRFQWRDPRSEPAFYRALFQTAAVRRRVSQMSSGTGGSMKNISKAKLETLALPDVDVEQQRLFAQRVAAIPRTDTALLDELFASLQSRAFRGEL